MVTEANAKLNLKTASRNVLAALGLSGPSAQWTTEEVTTYNKALAAEVLRYPNSFTPEILYSAQLIAARNYTSIEDAGFSWGAFVSETANNAPAVLGDFTDKLLMVAAVAAAVYFGVKAYQSANQGKVAK